MLKFIEIDAQHSSPILTMPNEGLLALRLPLVLNSQSVIIPRKEAFLRSIHNYLFQKQICGSVEGRPFKPSLFA